MRDTPLAPVRASDVPRIHREIAAEARRLAAASENATHLVPQAGPVAATMQAIGERSRFADRYLVSAEMSRVAVDAARDIPPMPVTQAQPSFDGALVYDGGLPPVQVPGFHVVVTPQVLVWTRAMGLPVLTLWGRAQTGDRERWVCPVVAEISDPQDIIDPDTFARPISGSTYALAMATWHLMAMPTVAQQRTSGPPAGRGGRGRKTTARSEKPRPVKVVELRRLARRGAADDDTERPGRTYRHQWVVRGHWRQQPVGQGRQQRRTTWVPSYVKGPEGAPLLGSETVFVWRR